MNTTTPDEAIDPAWQQWAEHEAAVLNGEQPPLFEPALERLRKQRDEVGGRDSYRGKAAGMKWAQTKAGFADLRNIVCTDFGGYVDAVFSHQSEDELTQAYLEGWLEGVQYVFDAI